VLEDFKKFIFKGDVVDLAVAVIIGLAFKAVIDSLVNDVINPIIGAIFGKPDFSSLTFDLGDGVVKYGSFITAVINFLIIAASLFVIIRSYEALQARRGKGGAEPEEPSDEVKLLTEIRDRLPSAT
jgi:large conductance mechanosensitive channel